MSFSKLLLSMATVGTTTLAVAIAAPASAQEHYAHKNYAHTHYSHTHYRHYAHYHQGRHIVVHAQEPAPVVQTAGYAWGPVAAVGNVVGGTGQAVEGVFTGAGAIVGGILGGVFGGASALFGYPPSYAYSAPFAAPFNAAGTVVAMPFHSVGGALGAPPPAHVVY